MGQALSAHAGPLKAGIPDADHGGTTARRGSGSSDRGITALQMEPMLARFNDRG
ncbi:hypothetical protein MUK42_08507 [Musa troglodytarum]|uniref:Uncharacterized protein n=1 Tax=Musa troglodytarum TaxID=320322 RepID=A0A9E7JQU4_9LILI|nr:hypothetical protein MUK42_08507 [Musa troglodytarum]